tara:strand:- start:27 stop:470 length:444 start_codon:yes stop_codon:yes gene_type:complete
MNKDLIIERLEMLITLIDETHPDKPTEAALFHHHSVQTLENIKHIRDYIKGSLVVDEDTQRETLIRIMKVSNRFWKIRNKIKDGSVDDLQLLDMEETIIEFLEEGSKINAIKYYREVMNDHFNERVTLRVAKDTIDAYSESGKARLW